MSEFVASDGGLATWGIDDGYAVKTDGWPGYGRYWWMYIGPVRRLKPMVPPFTILVDKQTIRYGLEATMEEARSKAMMWCGERAVIS